MDIKATLTKRIGPLPAWGWGAVIVGGIGVFLIMRKRTGATATGTQQDALGFGSATSGGGGGGSGGIPGVTATPSTLISGGGGGGNLAAILPHDESQSFTTLLSGGQRADAQRETFDLGWQPLAVQPISDQEEAIVRAGRASPEIAAKIIANNLASTIEFAAQQVGQAEQAIRISGAAMGQTAAQGEAENTAIVSSLVNKGYTASIVGGQIIAARTPDAYWNALNPTQQTALAKWIQGTTP